MIVLEIVSYFLLGSVTTLILWEIRKHRKGKEVRKIQNHMRDRWDNTDAEQVIEDVISNEINMEIDRRMFSDTFTPFRDGEEEDFTPKKYIKVHKLDQGKIKEGWIERAPGVYIRETDHSVMEWQWPPRRDNDLIG